MREATHCETGGCDNPDCENCNPETDDAEMWGEIKKERQAKRWHNVEQSLRNLRQNNIAFVTLNESVAHYRVLEVWDFWPTTGKFRNYKTGESGRGVFNLIKKVKSG